MYRPHSLAIKLLALTCHLLIGVPSDLLGQDTNEPRRSFMRPTWVTLTAVAKDSLEQRVYDGFKGLPISGKLNAHGSPPLAIQYDRSLAADTAKRHATILPSISPATAAIVGHWFGRDSAGGMDTRTILERGTYSETDLDRIINLLSAVDRAGMTGWQLLDLTYIPVFEVTKIERTYRVVKNETDPKKQSGFEKTLNAVNTGVSVAKGEVPVPKRDTSYYEGWAISWKVDLYKLDWTDSVEWQFAQRYWNDRNSPDPVKAAAWTEAEFPVRKVIKTGYGGSSALEREIIPGKPQPPLEDMLRAFAPGMQGAAVEYFTKHVRDMRPRAGVASDYPLTAKLGTKEGLRMNDRFIAYEYTLKKKKGMVLKRKGVLRVHKVAKNDMVADARSVKSTFQQQGGKRIERGMTVEEAHDAGMNIGVGWRVGDPLNTGPMVMLKTNLLGTVLGIPNWYLGGHGGLTFGSNIDASGLYSTSRLEGRSTTGGTLIVPGKWGGNGYEYGITLSKERYPFKRGNLYFEPAFSYSWIGFSVTKNGDVRLSNASLPDWQWTDDAEHAFRYKASMLSFAWGIAHHFGPVALELRPSIGIRSAFRYDSDESSSYTSPYGAANGGLFGARTLFTLTGGLKLRF